MPGIRVASAWFVNPAAIAAVNTTTIYAEKDKRYTMELIPQGLLVRVQGCKRPFLVGHVNIRSVELYEDPAQPSAGEPPEAGTEATPPAEPGTEANETPAARRRKAG